MLTRKTQKASAMVHLQVGYLFSPFIGFIFPMVKREERKKRRGLSCIVLANSNFKIFKNHAVGFRLDVLPCDCTYELNFSTDYL